MDLKHKLSPSSFYKQIDIVTYSTKNSKKNFFSEIYIRNFKKAIDKYLIVTDKKVYF